MQLRRLHDQVGFVACGVSYELSVSFFSEGTWEECVTAWIDWNQDKTFDEATERYDLDCGIDATFTTMIAVPRPRCRVSPDCALIEEWAGFPGDACTGATYGETEDYTIQVACEDVFGACCDPFTGVCEDGVEPLDCLAPMQFYFEESCLGTYPEADPWPALDPPCGNIGCCCEDDVSPIPFEEYELNCGGRFLGGVVGGECTGEAFSPPCGEANLCRILYAPTEADNAAFPSGSLRIDRSDCDYFDARAGTPTLAMLQEYHTVFTWANFATSTRSAWVTSWPTNVDLGGKVILGQWTYHSDQSNWLQGRIMDGAGLCPGHRLDQLRQRLLRERWRGLHPHHQPGRCLLHRLPRCRYAHRGQLVRRHIRFRQPGSGLAGRPPRLLQPR